MLFSHFGKARVEFWVLPFANSMAFSCCLPHYEEPHILTGDGNIVQYIRGGDGLKCDAGYKLLTKGQLHRIKQPHRESSGEPSTSFKLICFLYVTLKIQFQFKNSVLHFCFLVLLYCVCLQIYEII